MSIPQSLLTHFDRRDIRNSETRPPNLISADATAARADALSPCEGERELGDARDTAKAARDVEQGLSAYGLCFVRVSPRTFYNVIGDDATAGVYEQLFKRNISTVYGDLSRVDEVYMQGSEPVRERITQARRTVLEPWNNGCVAG